MDIQRQLRRLPLQGTHNTRDLGGYPCLRGATRWGVFLRSDHLARLSGRDIDELAAYGLTDVVELRRADEAGRTPSAHLGSGRFTTHAISLSGALEGADFEGDVPGSMAGLYIAVMEQSGPEIAQVMKALADARGAALFHCAVGKDRTGVTAMLLLKLADVADDDVVADYAVTEVYMRESLSAQQQVFQSAGVPEYVLRSAPESMRRTLRHLAEKYGTARRYLAACGVAQKTVDTLVEKLVQPAEQ